MTLPKIEATDRPSHRRRRGLPAAIAITAVLAVQVALLYTQTRVLARQERVLREREVLHQRVCGVADRIAATLESLSELQQRVPRRAVHFEPTPGDEQPVVDLPLPE